MAKPGGATAERTGTKERLLAVAARCFAEKGYQGATLREICEEAGANVAAVNYHFGDKHRLYVEAVRQAHRRRQEEVPLADWPADSPADEKLRDFVRTFLVRMLDEESLDHRGLMLREMARPSEATAELVREFIRPEFELLTGILRELAPEVPDWRLRLVVFSIVGQCLFYRTASPVVTLLLAKRELGRLKPDLLAEHVVGITLAGLDALKRSASTHKGDR